MTPEALSGQIRDIVSPKLPVPVNEILKTMNIDLEPFEFPNHVSGMFSEVQGHPVIGVNSRHSSTRRRFTIAHELYHFLTSEDSSIMAMTETKGGVEEVERRANRFAALLLMPEDAVKRLSQEGICVKHMAEIFDVSEQAMRIRLIELGPHYGANNRKVARMHGDCCELAQIQRLARAPYIEKLMETRASYGEVMQAEGHPTLPIFKAYDFLDRTGTGGMDYGD